MVKFGFTYARLQLFAIAVTSIFSMNIAAAENSDHFSFCSNTCKSPSCDEANIKTDCKKRCIENNVWKRVATQEMSENNKEFQSGDDHKSETMLYGSKIAKCLDLKAPEVQPVSPLPPAPNTSAKDDLCEAAYAALRAEVKLGREQATLKVQEQNIDRILGSKNTPANQKVLIDEKAKAVAKE